EVFMPLVSGFGVAASSFKNSRGPQAHASLLARQSIAPFEAPGPDDFHLIESLCELAGKWGEGRREPYDSHGGFIQYGVPRGFKHPQFLHAAVAVDHHQHAQAAMDALATGLFRIVEVADPLDLLAPFVAIPSADVAHGGCGVLAADAWALGVLLNVLRKLCFEAGNLGAQLRAVEGRGWWTLGFRLVLLRCVRGFFRLRGARSYGGLWCFALVAGRRCGGR